MATIRMPAGMGPGAYRAILVIEGPDRPAARAPLTFSAHDVGPWPEGFTVRREEIYGDDGRRSHIRTEPPKGACGTDSRLVLSYSPDSAILPAESVFGDDPGDLLARRTTHLLFDRRAIIAPGILADVRSTP